MKQTSLPIRIGYISFFKYIEVKLESRILAEIEGSDTHRRVAKIKE